MTGRRWIDEEKRKTRMPVRKKEVNQHLHAHEDVVVEVGVDPHVVDEVGVEARVSRREDVDTDQVGVDLAIRLTREARTHPKRDLVLWTRTDASNSNPWELLQWQNLFYRRWEHGLKNPK